MQLARILIDEGCEVFALSRPSAQRTKDPKLAESLHWVAGDILSPESYSEEIKKIKPELAFHLAWYVEPGQYLNSLRNLEMLQGTLRLVSLLGEIGCKKLVSVGTCFEYDTDIGYLSETSPTNPRSLYAASKLATSLVSKRIALLSEMSFVWARLFYMYGPHEDKRRLVPLVINSLLRGEEARTTKGEQIRDFLHVEDVARALWAIAKSNLSGVVNIGSGHPITIRDILMKTAQMLGRPDLIKFGVVPYDPADRMFVCSINQRLLEKTGWTERYTLDSGLEQTIEWWKKELVLGNKIER